MQLKALLYDNKHAIRNTSIISAKSTNYIGKIIIKERQESRGKNQEARTKKLRRLDAEKSVKSS